jgi:hypothetical protein
VAGSAGGFGGAVFRGVGGSAEEETEVRRPDYAEHRSGNVSLLTRSCPLDSGAASLRSLIRPTGLSDSRGRTLMLKWSEQGETDMAETVQDLNQRLADQINCDGRDNPQSPYAGKFVGIANGQVVVVADDLDAVARQLRQQEPDQSKTFCIEAGIDYQQVQDIWMVK